MVKTWQSMKLMQIELLNETENDTSHQTEHVEHALLLQLQRFPLE